LIFETDLPIDNPASSTSRAYLSEEGPVGAARRALNQVPTEELSEAEARLRHPGNAVVEFSIVNEDGERRRAIFVWESEDAMDQEGPNAMYSRADKPRTTYVPARGRSVRPLIAAVVTFRQALVRGQLDGGTKCSDSLFRATSL
jgi:hypothetical protein